MALADDPDRLPCGAQLDDVVAQVAGDAPATDAAHQAGCPYCQTALHGLRRGWGDLQTLADERVAIPTGLTSRIMSRVRAIAHQSMQHVVLAVPRGRTLIRHGVAAQVARRAALSVPGVLFASATAGPPTSARPDHVKLELRLATSYGPALTEIAGAVRALLRRWMTKLAGAAVDEIDIVFMDIAELEP